jgi:hypothetical protein
MTDGWYEASGTNCVWSTLTGMHCQAVQVNRSSPLMFVRAVMGAACRELHIGRHDLASEYVDVL